MEVCSGVMAFGAIDCMMNIKLYNRGILQSLLILYSHLSTVRLANSTLAAAVKDGELEDVKNSTLRPSNGRIRTRLVFRPCWILYSLGSDSSSPGSSNTID